MAKRATICIALATALVLAPSASAQERSLDIERFRPAPDRDGFLGIPGTRTPGEWAWNVALWAGYSLDPLTLVRVDTGAHLPVVHHRFGADLLVQLGLFDRVAAVLDIPVIAYQRTNAELVGGPAIAAVAFRDPYFAVRVRVLGEGANGEHGDHEGEGLALQVATTIPIGLEQNFAGEGVPQLEGALLADFHFLDFGVGAIIGYRHRFAEPSLLGVGFANELFFGAAVESPVFFIENVSVIVESRVDTAIDSARVPGGEIFYGPSTALAGDLGVRWSDGDLSMTWMVGTGFASGVGAPTFRAQYGFEWAPRTHDADGDGIHDSLEPDGCLRLPEDDDGFEDEDGCPDPDNDGDQIADEDDRCPNEAPELGRDADEDGCIDAIADADSDAIADDVDRCPNDPEDRDGNLDEDGCPELDNDDDTVADTADRCPALAEDRDAFEDEDGCPDPDNDADGVADADDRCPLAAEDRDSFEDGDGCIDPDNDRDGVLDQNDRCADQIEAINGVDDADGCSDSGGQALWVVLGETRNLRGRIRFDPNGAVLRASVGAVDQLARHLVARWGARWSIALAEGQEARLPALRQALVDRGVPPDRFEVITAAQLRDVNVEVRRLPGSSAASDP